MTLPSAPPTSWPAAATPTELRVQGPSPADVTRRAVRIQPVAGGLVLLAVVAALAALLVGSWSIGALGIAAATLVAADALLARMALRRAQVSLSGPQIATTGTAGEHTLTIRGQTQPLEIAYPGHDMLGRWSVLVDSHAPNLVMLECPNRGEVPWRVVDVIATGPLGLAESAFRARAWLPVATHVLPAPAPHDLSWPALQTAPTDETTTVSRGTDIYRGVRPYRRSDSRRWVHWPATAHHGHLMVKEHDGLEQVALRVVVELATLGGRADDAVARAAWLVEQALVRQWHVQLVTVDAATPEVGLLGVPWGPLPLSPVSDAIGATISRRVSTAPAAHRQLATAGRGTPVWEPWSGGMTRVVTDGGDRWM